MLEWPDETIYQGIAAVRDRDPERTALLFEGERRTYGELLAEGEALARGLAELGVGDGDRVAVWLGNRPQWVTTQLAASYLGAVLVTVNTRYRTHELSYLLEDAGCRALVTEESFLDNDYLSMLSEVVPEVRTADADAFDPESVAPLEEVVALEEHSDYPAVRGYDAVVERGQDRDGPAPAEDGTAPAAMFYTSGTTSDPKGCLHDSRSLLNHSYNVGTHLGVGADDVALGALPFCGVWGYNMAVSALSHGIPQVVQTHFEPGRTVDLIDEHGVTYMSGLVRMFQRMQRSEAFAPERVATLERGAVGFITMSYDEETFEQLEETFGFPIVQPYGLSEGNSQVFIGVHGDPMERRKGVGGPPVDPGAEVRIADPETGETLPPGETGELCVRGYNVMLEYDGKPEQTEAAFDDDGWLHTGDLGTRDEEGYFYFESRLDDALRVRGFLVAPREIETAVDDHPGVDEAQVVGAPHPRHGEVPVAFVKRADPSLEGATLREFLRSEVADYKVPEDVEFVAEFPRTESPNGAKIQKTELRDRVVDRYREE